MLGRVLGYVYRLAHAGPCVMRGRVARWLRPGATDPVVLGAAADLVRGKPEPVAENAFLRQQVIILARSTRRPRITGADRALLVVLASRVRTGRQALVVVRPATLLRWHRAGFRLFWRWRSTPRSRRPRVAPDAVALLERMAREGVGPRFVSHDHDAKDGSAFDRLAAGSGVEVIRTPVRAPRANAVCGRFLGSARRACVDRTLVLGERHLRRVLAEYVASFTGDRPPQGIEQRAPVSLSAAAARRQTRDGGQVGAIPVLGGLHHAYRPAA